MKYLQLYDHLGNLVKEFEVYVDGQDFDWAAEHPEPVWLGTIKLSTTKAVESVEPTPEPEKDYLEKEIEESQIVAGAMSPPELEESELEVIEEQEVQPQAPFTTQETTTEEQPKKEVKHEPKKRSHKRSGSKGTSSSTSSKRSKDIS